MSTAIEEKIKTSLVNGRLPCEVAFRIAREIGVDPKLVKETADELEIKISSCQLGCFP